MSKKLKYSFGYRIKNKRNMLKSKMLACQSKANLDIKSLLVKALKFFKPKNEENTGEGLHANDVHILHTDIRFCAHLFKDLQPMLSVTGQLGC